MTNNEIKKCNILGVNIASVNMSTLLKFVEDNLKELSGKYICVSNVHTVITAYDDKTYMNVQNSSALSIPDGGPLSSYGRKHGFKDMDRTTGPDFFYEILKISEENNYKHYFYGSTEDTLKKLKEKLLSEFPKLKIAGMYSPPFRKLTEIEDEDVMNKINAANSDFVWVGLGAPKQEIWMYEHKDKVKGLMVGIGAAFDYFAGNIKRAPMWMQKHNLEWLYRLMQDPGRLFTRYLYTNSKFLFLTKLVNK